MFKKTIAEIASLINATVVGDASTIITGIATLDDAGDSDLSFCHQAKYRQQLLQTKAGVVIVSQALSDQSPCAALIVDDPYFAYSTIVSLFDYKETFVEGVHPRAVVGKNTQIHETASIAANVVIGDHVTVAAGCVIGANTVIADYVTIGKDSRFYPNVTVCHHAQIGERTVLHPGVVIGSDGFGNAMHEGRWQKIAQIGRVVIGNDVDIGANTTVDRGALGHTVIEDGVRLDNLIQIGHNVTVGQNTAMAACSGVAGSAKIGKNCMIGGGARIGGHLSIVDGTVLARVAEVSKSIKIPNIYCSGTGLMTIRAWRKNVIRFRHLDESIRQLKVLLKKGESHE
jgi:UDP-3-O-[3-hydroxymyristoyl] glucosamine N-acyltransferase